MTDIRTTIGDTRFDVRACGLLLDGESFLVATEEDGTMTDLNKNDTSKTNRTGAAARNQ